MGEILEQITKAELVLADVTGRNPNVFYELGITHSVVPSGHVLILTQDEGDVPFDIRQYRYLRYEVTEAGLAELQQGLEDTLKDIAPKSLTFQVAHGQGGGIERKLLGQDRWLYAVEVPEAYTGDGFAKFRLLVIRSGLGKEPPATIHDDAWGLEAGEGVEIPGLGWGLILEEARDDAALFRLASDVRSPLRRVE